MKEEGEKGTEWSLVQDYWLRSCESHEEKKGHWEINLERK